MIPSFDLPPCPRCSTRIRLIRPEWMIAKWTSQKHGHACYIWTGCEHAARFRGILPTGDLAEMATLEKAWCESVSHDFAAFTAHWTQAQRETFAREIGITLSPSQPKTE